VIVLIFAAVIGASAYGLFFVPIGLELSELVPLGTAPQAFMVAREKYFSFYPMYTVVKGDDPQFGSFAPKSVQKKMHDFVHDTENVSFVVNMKIRTDWLSVMTDWLKFAQEKFDADSIKGAFNESNEDSLKPSRMGKIARKLMCSFGDKTDCSRIGKIRLVDKDGLVNEDGFYNYLTAWYNLDQMTYYVTQANFQPTPPPFDYEKDEHIPAAKHLIFSQIPFYVDRINDTNRILEMINAVRHVCENYTASGLPVFPLGIPFTFWELYLHLTTSLLTAFAIIIVAVFIAISIILINPWISALIVIVLMLMIVVELGFMGLIHIKLNPISAVTLITAVGIRVKFTVHVALSFLTTVGTRAERVARTLEHMFVPVLHGGLSTLVGLIMLYFSKFEFIVMYYFLVMFFLVILGILSGLILMPIILSWIGPPVEVKSFDNSSYFYPPNMDGRTSNSGKQPQIAVTSYPTMEMGFMATNGNQPIKND
uniref:Uncharacterized protein n=1 Tax=Romanomermis culicivorax TaxID=13658 RepID=A0A915HYU9_ROMCU